MAQIEPKVATVHYPIRNCHDAASLLGMRESKPIHPGSYEGITDKTITGQAPFLNGIL